ncbi:MAG: N(4)-(beta-N-acetylglucosaminyl)-L-asparaginase [bacterium]
MNKTESKINNSPIIISTWKFGCIANEFANRVLEEGGSAFDAIEKGINAVEDDPKVKSVGYGGLPDQDGVVTLDACIMDEKGNLGAVAFINGIRHAISVARMVIEKTDHILLVGKGAEDFAKSQGFKRENLLTEKSKVRWFKWLKSHKGKIISKEDHDTITMLIRDKNGDLYGGCSTSGIRWKMHGRVGDSPIIGAGLYVDNDVGGAGFTGRGEDCIRICGSHLIVELMRNGAGPQDACTEAIIRITKRYKRPPKYNCAFISISRDGKIGAFSLKKGFVYALMIDGKNELYEAEYLYK